ncbi:MAG: DUF421 domain-containing protein [Clostridiales bacterium]|nr:DUF421 domain-containing protein [Clostridiales bacterium]
MSIIFFRTIIIFTALLVAMRLMGKRQLGELELSELVVAVLISDIAAHPLQDISIPLMNGLLPIIILLSCELLLSGGMIKSVRFRSLICGRPSMLIENGVINQTEMKNCRFTLDELAEELRTHGIIDISEVKFALLETSGKLNIILFPAERPVTVSQLGLEADDPGYPHMIINNGKLLSNNLKLCGKDKNWLKKQLSAQNVSDVSDVYLMSVNSDNQVYFLKKEDVKK